MTDAQYRQAEAIEEVGPAFNVWGKPVYGKAALDRINARRMQQSQPTDQGSYGDDRDYPALGHDR